MRIMMSAAGSPVAHGVIRHLQSLGHYVIGHDCSPFGSAADEFHISPPIKSEDDYLEFLAEAAFAGGCDVYLPFLDEELRLPDIKIAIGVAAMASPAETLKIFTSKILQQHAMEDAGLPVAPEHFQRPYICKPDYGRGGKQIVRTDNYEVAMVLAEEGWLVQQFIHGEEYTVDVLTDAEGQFLFAVPRLRIRANGVSTIGRIDMDAEVLRLAAKVVASFKFAGPINIQMIREKDTGKLFIIEVNPRLSGSCMFTVMAGFDILSATIRLHLGLRFEPPGKIEEITVKRHYVEERL